MLDVQRSCECALCVFTYSVCVCAVLYEMIPVDMKQNF
jgi:hypothetical protein